MTNNQVKEDGANYTMRLMQVINTWKVILDSQAWDEATHNEIVDNICTAQNELDYQFEVHHRGEVNVKESKIKT